MGIMLTIFFWLYMNDLIDFNTMFITFTIAKISFILWDITVDWNLLHLNNSKYFLLRAKLLFPAHWYYIAIMIDIVARWCWLLVIFGQEDIFINLMISVIDIIRRVTWIIFRFESEFTNNKEGYRKANYVPSLPMLK